MAGVDGVPAPPPGITPEQVAQYDLGLCEVEENTKRVIAHIDLDCFYCVRSRCYYRVVVGWLVGVVGMPHAVAMVPVFVLCCLEPALPLRKKCNALLSPIHPCPAPRSKWR